MFKRHLFDVFVSLSIVTHNKLHNLRCDVMYVTMTSS